MRTSPSIPAPKDLGRVAGADAALTFASVVGVAPAARSIGEPHEAAGHAPPRGGTHMTTRITGALVAAAMLTAGLAAPAAAAVINGTSGPDLLIGTTADDTIHGYGGLDQIRGKAGADRIYAGNDSKRDLVHGGPGNDVIFSRFGDTVYGGLGDDVIHVGVAAWRTTQVYCGPGVDHVYGNTDSFLVRLHGCEKVN